MGCDCSSVKRTDSVLDSVSDSYSEAEEISVGDSRHSSLFLSYLHCLLITSNSFPKENINDFGLRRPFYSKQGF